MVPLSPSSDLNFNFKFDPAKDATEDPNWRAEMTNAFYTVNSIHDLSYRYGFTEQLFNFQVENFNKGGKGGDPVTVNLYYCEL